MPSGEQIASKEAFLLIFLSPFSPISTSLRVFLDIIGIEKDSSMYIPTFWQEKITPLLYLKDDNVFGCKLRTYGYSQSEQTNWFGNMVNFKHFGKSKEKPYTFSNEVEMLIFEFIGLIVARTYILVWLAVVIGVLVGIFTLQAYTLLISIVVGLFLYLYPKICFWAYKRYVEKIPMEKGWMVFPLLDEESLMKASKYVKDEKVLINWIKKSGPFGLY